MDDVLTFNGKHETSLLHKALVLSDGDIRSDQPKDKDKGSP